MDPDARLDDLCEAVTTLEEIGHDLWTDESESDDDGMVVSYTYDGNPIAARRVLGNDALALALVGTYIRVVRVLVNLDNEQACGAEDSLGVGAHACTDGARAIKRPAVLRKLHLEKGAHGQLFGVQELFGLVGTRVVGEGLDKTAHAVLVVLFVGAVPLAVRTRVAARRARAWA